MRTNFSNAVPTKAWDEASLLARRSASRQQGDKEVVLGKLFFPFFVGAFFFHGFGRFLFSFFF
jgi:hypothetical protein